MQRPYLRDRLIEERPEGYVVIVPADAVPPVPLSCPVCTCVLRSRNDEQAYNELQCCDWCARTWAHARREEWTRGWRPSTQQVEEALSSPPPVALVLSTG